MRRWLQSCFPWPSSQRALMSSPPRRLRNRSRQPRPPLQRRLQCRPHGASQAISSVRAGLLSGVAMTSSAFPATLLLIRRCRRVQLNVPFDPDQLDQVELPLQEIDMLLLVIQDAAQQVA